MYILTHVENKGLFHLNTVNSGQLIYFSPQGLWETKHDLKNLHWHTNKSVLWVDRSSNEEQSGSKSNMNPNESFVRITVLIIYEFQHDKTGKSPHGIN